MAWTATLQPVTTQGGNVVATIVFNNPQTGETITNVYPASSLTMAAVQQIAQSVISALQVRDASLPSLVPGLISLT